MTKETSMPFHTVVFRGPIIATVTLFCGAAILGGCKGKPPLDNAANVAAAPVALPPPISKSQIYRCKDNSLVYVDVFADNLSVNLRTSKSGPVNRLVAQTAGGPFSGEGYVLSGSGKKVSVTTPGKPAQSCSS